MPAPRLALILVLAALPAVADEIRPGDSLADVKSALGPPRGQVNVDGRSVLYYERGEVELTNDSVTRIALRTPEEHAALAAREERQRAVREARRAQLVAEGIALRNQKLADPDFKSAPLAYQVSFWESFAAAYPGVSVLEPLTIARLKYGEQLAAKQAKEQELARAAAREERLAELDRDQRVYPLYTSSPYYRRYRHGYDPVSFGDISYNFFPSPLPPYTTPSGSPAGVLRSPVYNPPATNPALPDRDDDRNDRWNTRRDRG
jgi:hypothetical protein